MVDDSDRAGGTGDSGDGGGGGDSGSGAIDGAADGEGSPVADECSEPSTFERMSKVGSDD
jgi:hypothetical protein